MTFSKKYSPSFESDIYTYREQHGVFKPKASKWWERFVTLLPPPNVTGNLHLGHSIMCAIQDVMVRYNRMNQKETVWIPGTDHASISTQVVVEKMLREQGIHKEDLGREKFLAKVWERVTQTRSTIVSQIRSMWASIDREREQFTMSEALSRGVRHAFKKLYDQWTIYKWDYMVNRSPGAQTVLSDLEVENKEIKTKMYFIRYFLQWKGDAITVATIRPETIFADVALAVHPKDRRYKKYIGKNVLIPIINRPIPVIPDENVQIEFGTWALKITPTHSEIDYDIAKVHELPMNIYAFDKNNIYTDQAWEDFAWKNVYEFMENLVYHLQEIWNIEKIEDYETTIPVCERTWVTVQPLLSKQWFMGVKRSAEVVYNAFENEQVAVHPPKFQKTFLNWLEDIRPWCISRQLWWWHRIPVRYTDNWEKLCFDETNVLQHNTWIYQILSMIIFNCIADSRLTNPFSLESLLDLLTQTSIVEANGRVIDVYCAIYKEKYKDDPILLNEITLLESFFDQSEWVENIEDHASWIVEMLEQSMNIQSVMDAYSFNFYSNEERVTLQQDGDVLDTWFSSALLPFTSLWWPEQSDDFKKYYPNTMLETWYDIIFFRVIRMMLLWVEMTNTLPFNQVYFHGLVRAEDWSKMSKSKWNGVDPTQIIETYWSDALRGSLLLWNTPWTDQKFSMQKVEYVARFINKLWNASRFAVHHYFGWVENVSHHSFDRLEKNIIAHLDALSEYDIWMIDMLHQTVQTTTRYQEKFMLWEALQEVITFLWHQFCDWYIEIVKIAPSPVSDRVMMYVLWVSYKLLHPSLPFMSEKLWQHLWFEGILAEQVWPEIFQLEKKNYRIALLMDLISQWRSLKNELIDKPHEKVSVFIKSNKDIHELVRHHIDLITHIVNIDTIEFLDENQSTPDWFALGMVMDIALWVKWIKEVNPHTLIKELQDTIREEEAFLQRLRATLTAPWFVDKAPVHVVEEKKQKMQEVKVKISSLEFEINKLKMTLK